MSDFMERFGNLTVGEAIALNEEAMQDSIEFLYGEPTIES